MSERQQRAALALAEAIVPGSERIPPADLDTLAAVSRMVEHVDPRAPAIWARALQALDSAALLRTGRRFQSLSRERQQRLLEQWERDPVLRTPLSLVALVLKFVHFDRVRVYGQMGGRLNVVEQLETPRWLDQVSRGADWAGEDLEAEVVVVGTGAGGAVVGKELVDRGAAVVFVEEGELVRRDRFTGSSRTAHLQFYRAAFSLGNAPMPVFIGRMVGGSTAVNGGTCFETPSWVLERWCETMDTDAFAPEDMAPHFEKVKEMLQMAPSPKSIIGPMGDLMARGADALGWSHFPILRNAPGCNGEGFCDFGCRTDARRSTNISYMPSALERGGMLVTELSAEK
ncbi:MAG: GMC family oxidoreductase N-terminal domain-containing protein, partial [Myxococcota bacterium]